MRAIWIFAVAIALAITSWAGATSQSNKKQQPQNPNARDRAEENAQEKASGIHDNVDIISGPNVEGVTPTAAWLSWTTNGVAATRVRYGTNAADPSQHAYVAGGSKQHRVELKNLKPGSTYHYEIETRGGKDRFKGSFQTPR